MGIMFLIHQVVFFISKIVSKESASDYETRSMYRNLGSCDDKLYPDFRTAFEQKIALIETLEHYKVDPEKIELHITAEEENKRLQEHCVPFIDFIKVLSRSLDSQPKFIPYAVITYEFLQFLSEEYKDDEREQIELGKSFAMDMAKLIKEETDIKIDCKCLNEVLREGKYHHGILVKTFNE